MLTGVLDWLLGVNVNRSLARPIYATTPRCGAFHVHCMANRRRNRRGRLRSRPARPRARRRIAPARRPGSRAPAPGSRRRWHRRD
ncbi:MAG: hypothetical protein VB124_05820 [Burkholderia sp.]